MKAAHQNFGLACTPVGIACSTYSLAEQKTSRAALQLFFFHRFSCAFLFLFLQFPTCADVCVRARVCVCVMPVM